MVTFDLDLIRGVVCDAGNYALERQGKVFAERKDFNVGSGTSDYLKNKIVFSEVDLDVQKKLMMGMLNLYPGIFGIVAEETDKEILNILPSFSYVNRFPNGKYTLVMDPIDGTKNYLSATPSTLGKISKKRFPRYWGVSLAGLYGTEPLFTVIDYPAIGLTLCAEKGSGVYLNGERILFRNLIDYSDSDNVRVSSAITNQKEIARHFPKVGHSGSFVVNLLSFFKDFSAIPMRRLNDESELVKHSAYFGFNTDVVDFAGCPLAYKEAGGFIGGIDRSAINPYDFTSFEEGNIAKIKVPYIMAPNKRYFDSLLGKLESICGGDIQKVVRK